MDSSQVTAGNNAKASEYNNLRADVIEGSRRAFEWFLPGTETTGNEKGAVWIVPYAMTVIAIGHRTASGTCTLRVQRNTDDVKSGISVNNSFTETTAGLENTSLSKGDEISIDLTAVSSPVDLRVYVECKVHTG